MIVFGFTQLFALAIVVVMIADVILFFGSNNFINRYLRDKSEKNRLICWWGRVATVISGYGSLAFIIFAVTSTITSINKDAERYYRIYGIKPKVDWSLPSLDELGTSGIMGLIILIVMIVMIFQAKSRFRAYNNVLKANAPQWRDGSYNTAYNSNTAHMDRAEFCVTCGTKVRVDSVFCEKCGNKVV